MAPRLDQPHTVPHPPNLLLIIREDTGPCGQCSSPGLYLLRDAGQVEKVLCSDCLDSIRQVLGMQLDGSNSERAETPKPTADFDYFSIPGYEYGYIW